MPITGFEPRISRGEIKRSTKCATKHCPKTRLVYQWKNTLSPVKIWANLVLFLFIFVLFTLQFKFKLKKNGARCCAWDSNPGHRMVGADSSIEQCHYCFHLGFYLDYPYSCFQLSKFLFSAMSGCCGQKSWHLKCFQLGLSEFLIATI